MWVQAVGIAAIILARGFGGFVLGSVLLGVGTAMVYPTLLAAIGDVAHPSWRASSVGVYRLWRDLGYAVGAMLAGVTADAFGLSAAMWVIAALTFGSGVVVAVRMTETLRRTTATSNQVPAWPCIGPAELKAAAQRGRAFIVDVRSPAEFAQDHVAGAVNIPLDQIGSRWTEVPRDVLVVTVCGKGGGRSERGARELRDRGCNEVRSLCGGTDAWHKYEALGD
jgi:rhodanese-related sulfurtransferase